MKLNKPEDALSSCKEALELDARNVKALYRVAMAFKMQEKYPDAVNYLQQVLEIDENNETAKIQLRLCKKLAAGEKILPVIT